MLYLTLALFAAAIVALDQLTKYLTVAHFAPYVQSYTAALASGAPWSGVPAEENIAVIPGIFHITFTGNTGAAFSMLENSRTFFLLITAVFLALVVVCVWKKWLKSKPSLFALAAVTGGAVGNLIDRMVQSYVVDMIEVEFVRFAVFNVADCFITCGAIALILFVFLEDRKEKKK